MHGGDEDMVTIGVDAHKRMHMAVALDDAGRVIDQWRGPNTADGDMVHFRRL